MEERWLRGAPPDSEDEVLSLIDALFKSKSAHTPLGRGHDCAVLAEFQGQMALSTDMFWQDRHFRTDYFTPAEVGAKALSAAVSDLAAAGAVPLGFSLDLLLPPWLGMQSLEEVLRGMSRKARDYGIILAGGDLSGGDELGFSIAVWGRRVRPDTPFLQRSAARPGDRIFLVGESGLARLGLLLLEQEGRNAAKNWPLVCAALLSPHPLLAEGQALACLAAKADVAMPGSAPSIGLMDLSDGLARDLPRLLGACGAILEPCSAKVSTEVEVAIIRSGRRREELFLLGGEDYALLGSCIEDLWPLLRQVVPGAKSIGRVRSEPGLIFDGTPFCLEGFDHFTLDRSGIKTKGQRLPSEIEVARQNLIQAGREAWQAGLMAGFNGNISCRLGPQEDEQGQACLISRSGSAKSRLGSDDFALVALDDGRVIAGASASSELGLHIEVYKACPGSSAILHVHPPHMLALSLLLPQDERFALPLPEAEHYKKLLGHVPALEPGSEDLALAVAVAAKSHEAVWMERHGLVVHGSDAATLISLAEELEHLALIRLQSLGCVARR